MFKNFFKKDKEAQKQKAVSQILGTLFNWEFEFNHTEQAEVLNRVRINFLERKKDGQRQLLKEAREIQESIKEIKL
jgi:hypothetical protein